MSSALKSTLFMAVAIAMAGPSVDAQEGGADPIRFTYLGAAGWEVNDGTVTVLIDPYISRLKYGDGVHPEDPRPNFARTDPAWSDTTLIDEIITVADFILIHHGHYDHLGDVPYIAKKTGAKVIGTETVITILRAYGVPEDQLYAVQGGEDYQFDSLSESSQRYTRPLTRSATMTLGASRTRARCKCRSESTSSSKGAH